MDFVRINSKSYKVWRILQASGVWGQVYRDREERLRNYRSAIIFPEQLLGLNQTQLFITTIGSMTLNTRTVSVASVDNKHLQLHGGTVSHYNEIYEWEGENNGSEALKGMTIGTINHDPDRYFSSGSNTPFSDLNLFSSKRDAVKMAQGIISRF